MNPEPLTEESSYDRTPNGGVRSTIYYKDAQGNPVDKSRAMAAEIIEYDTKGNHVHRTYLDLAPPSEEPTGVTPELIQFSRQQDSLTRQKGG